MFELVTTKRFKKSYKRVSQLKGFKRTVFVSVVSDLVAGKPLDKKYKDHALTGNMKGYRECHLAPDILLIYEIDNGILTLTLVNVGNHAQLFK